VPRAWLSDALERGIPGVKLALVIAPAGLGKSKLLGQWARTSRFRVAWLSLAEDDNAAERFLRYLFTAWDSVDRSTFVPETAAAMRKVSRPNSVCWTGDDIKICAEHRAEFDDWVYR
jgi:ATP/maltotriose-dependent transcriptional regulator MalT